MRRKSVCVTLLCLAVVLILAMAAPAGAVIGGTPDTANSYSNVGMNMEYGWLPGYPTSYAIAGTCTLVRNEPPNNVIVLCAAHMLAWDAFTLPNRVIFEPLTDADWAWAVPDSVAYGPNTYEVLDHAIHTGFDPAPYQGYSRRDSIGPTREDVALMWLDRQVLDPDTGKAVVPATVVGLHGLDDIDVRGEMFRLVGYGLNGWLQGNSIQATHNGKVAASWSGRNYGDASVVCTEAAYLDRYLKLTSAACDFDSGGPVFHGNPAIDVAVASFAEDGGNAPAYFFRLDTKSAQDFLHENGVPTLP